MKLRHPDGREHDNVTQAEFFRIYGPAGFVPVEDQGAADEPKPLKKAYEHEVGEHAEPRADAVDDTPDGQGEAEVLDGVVDPGKVRIAKAAGKRA